MPLPSPPHPFGPPLRAGNLTPTLESLPHLIAVRRHGQPMPPGAEALGTGAIRRPKALGMPRGGEPLHTTLALARRSMGVLTPVIAGATLAVLPPWQELTLGRALALQLVGNDDAEHVP
jgi:hypothetical protein